MIVKPRRTNALKGFTLECGVVETLVISRALSRLAENEEVPQADRQLAEKMRNEIRCLDTTCSE